MASNNTFRNLRNTMRSTNYNSYGFPSEFTNLNLAPGNGPLGLRSNLYTRPNINVPEESQFYMKLTSTLQKILNEMKLYPDPTDFEIRILMDVVKNNIRILLEDKPETIDDFYVTLQKFVEMPRFKSKKKKYFKNKYDSETNFDWIQHLLFLHTYNGDYLNEMFGGRKMKTKQKRTRRYRKKRLRDGVQ